MSTLTLQPNRTKPPRYDECPNAQGWLRGTCQHNNVRWLRLSCKRRTCPICGLLRKRKTAHRITHGIQTLGKAAWFVGTWSHNVDKKDAVQTQNHFIQWLRRDRRQPIQYAAVWETHSSGRLHLNLILAPWTYIDQRQLSQKWQDFGGGKVVWIERVDPTVSTEVTKLGNYMAKFEQMVLTGRGINYSRDWPKIPDNPLQRQGQIQWTWLPSDYDEAELFEQDVRFGFWAEIAPGEYSLAGLTEPCNCFQYDLADHQARSTLPDHYQPHQ